MLNGDVLTDIDLTEQIAQHERDRREGDARAGARPRPHRLRARAPARGSLGEGLRREAELRQDRHEPDQRGRLRARARDPRAGAAGSQRLDRARGLAAADRQRPVRVPLRQLLAGHRHARALPAGHVRHHRGQRRDGGDRAARQRLAGDRRRRRGQRARDPAGGARARRARRGGRARRQPGRARRTTCRSARARPSSAR